MAERNIKWTALVPALNAILAFAFVLRIAVVGTHTDAWAYFSLDVGDPYRLPVNTAGAFQYSPAFALALEPLRWLGWHVFLAAWTTVLIGALYALVGRSLFGLVLLLPPVAWEVEQGNVHLLLALIVLRPALWPFGLLTKITPAITGLWQAARGEWRGFSGSMAVTGAIVLVTEMALPGSWLAWSQWLLTNIDPVALDKFVPLPLWLRLPLAVALVVYAARTDRRWPLALAIWLSLPTMWFQAAPIMLAVLARQQRLDDREPRRVGGARVNLPGRSAVVDPELDLERV